MAYFQPYFWQNPAKFMFKTQSFRSVLSLTETISGITQVYPPSRGLPENTLYKDPNKVWFQKIRTCTNAILHFHDDLSARRRRKILENEAITGHFECINGATIHLIAIGPPYTARGIHLIPVRFLDFQPKFPLIPQKSANSGLNPGKSQNTPHPPHPPPYRTNLGSRYFVE